MAVDKYGKKVQVGSKVRLLHVDPKITEYLPVEEVDDINSMLNEIFDVYEIRGDFVCIEKTWDRGQGRTESHSLSLVSEDFELVST